MIKSVLRPAYETVVDLTENQGTLPWFFFAYRI
jgi:hypothetical protein